MYIVTVSFYSKSWGMVLERKIVTDLPAIYNVLAYLKTQGYDPEFSNAEITDSKEVSFPYVIGDTQRQPVYY